jgi:cellulose synthase/poly-beta-1,6-N-acetylglucosamine synthase-like glycosyltransferase
VIFLWQIFTGLKKIVVPEENLLSDEFISVIIPFRNEKNNILNCYQSLCGQNYPKEKYEIIFVNDSSTDESLEILKNYSYASNVKIVSVPENYYINAHKKRAIKYGISKADGNIIVTTDADCTHPEYWLRNLLKFMDKETGFVSGPVKFHNANSLFDKVQSLEFAGLIIAGAGLIGYGKPIICNAANIAYRKKIFDEIGGFDHQMDLSSGDDELLMQKIYSETNYKIKFALDKKTVVSTHSNHSIKDFYYQRKRWASKGLFYGNRPLILKLILIYLFYLSVLVQPIFCVMYSSIFFITFIVSLIIKISSEYLILKRGASQLFNKDLLKPFIITELIQVPYITIVGIAGLFGNFIWKDRKITR